MMKMKTKTMGKPYFGMTGGMAIKPAI